MLPRTEAILQELARHRAELRAAIDAVPAARRAVRPAADRWSVELVVDHLAVVEASLARMLASRLRELPPTTLVAAFAAPPAPTAALDARQLLDLSRRVVAGANAQPRGGVAVDAAWAELQQSRAALLEVARAADGRDVASIRAPHPALGPLGFWQWVEFVGLHEARHAAQIRELAAGPAGGDAAG